jgi:Tol biopolymer transport system component
MRRIGSLGALIVVAAACGSPADPSPAPSLASPSVAAVVRSPSAAPSATTRPTPTPLPQLLDGESWIVFQTRTAGGYGVHFVRPDGTGLHKWPAPVSGTQEHPDWSPDGSRILLNTVMPDRTEDLWVADVDGSNPRMLLDCVAPCAWIDEAAWSPDGRRIAFQRLEPMEHGHLISTLELLDVDTGATEVVLVMPDQQVVLQPRWSPDGRRIVVEVIHLTEDRLDADVDDGAIGIVDLDDPDPRVRRIAGEFANSPDWSPDGTLVLWSRPGPDGGSDVWVAKPDGSDARRVSDLAATGGGADQPAFTPDSQAIIFVWSEPGQPGRIGRIGVDGTGLASAVGDLTVDAMHPRVRPTP